jgi:hypothetical protein
MPRYLLREICFASLNFGICDTTLLWRILLKSKNCFWLFSNDPNILLKRNDEIKNKLHEELKDELRAISSAGDAPAAKPLHKSPATTADKKPRVVDSTDYFELVYECLQTRRNFLNIISLNSRNPVEPDIDLVILQALLNGKKSKKLISSMC